MRKILIVVSLAAAAVLSVAVTAQAHMLSFNKAASVTRAVAEKDCDRDPDCQQYGAFKNDCKRASQHRVRCYAINVGTDSEGDYVCEHPVLVKMKRSGKLIYATGNRTCSRV